MSPWFAARFLAGWLFCGAALVGVWSAFIYGRDGLRAFRARHDVIVDEPEVDTLLDYSLLPFDPRHPSQYRDGRP